MGFGTDRRGDPCGRWMEGYLSQLQETPQSEPKGSLVPVPHGKKENNQINSKSCTSTLSVVRKGRGGPGSCPTTLHERPNGRRRLGWVGVGGQGPEPLRRRPVGRGTIPGQMCQTRGVSHRDADCASGPVELLGHLKLKPEKVESVDGLRRGVQ